MNIEKHFGKEWGQKLSPFLLSKAFKDIGTHLNKDISEGKTITPLLDNTFRAFRECPYEDLKVMMLGLDPYPQKGVADGLAFSTRVTNPVVPTSLQYILNAMEKDVYGGFGIGYNEEYDIPDLTRWANQGVLLLNCALSTHVGQTGVHLALWMPFIKAVFATLREHNTGLIYILVGREAQKWHTHIDKTKNHVLQCTHPASASYQGLKEWDCNKIFSQTNELLEKMNGSEAKILW